MDILIGILIVLLGLAIATMGLRVWFWTLPVLGFISGFFVGTAGVYQLFGDGILATALSWAAGLVVGVVFALLSWFWWYLGVIIAAGAAGSAIGTGLAVSVGADRDWVIFIVGLVAAVVFAFVALVFNLPTFIVIVTTGIGGALAVVSGLLLVFNRVDLENFGGGNAVAIIRDSLGWWLLWAAIAAIGIVVQMRLTALVSLPDDRFVPITDSVRR